MSTESTADVTHPVRIETTRPRPTPAPAGRRFRDALDASADTLLGGVEAASALVPGGAVVSAAVRSGRGGAGGVAGSAEAPGGRTDMGDLQSSMMEDNMDYLRIQQQMQAENRRYSTLSNVMKARHETAKNAINNIR